jgi:hypothetical protein
MEDCSVSGRMPGHPTDWVRTMGKPERTVEDWIQEQLVEPDATMLQINLGWMPSVGLGSVHVQRFHPVTKVLMASRVTVNLRRDRIAPFGLYGMAEWMADFGIPLGGIEPFPERPVPS